LFGPKVKEQIDWIGLELHMAIRREGMRSLVDIAVVRPQPANQPGQEQFCEQICRELRAYLMVGR
jgi:hypothetical protein